MQPLKGKIAVAAGASRGAGRGIALALGEAGATVYVVGRTTRAGPKPPDGAPGTVEDTADEVTARGGVGIAARADCTAEADVAELFERVRREQGKIDVLANAVWGGADAYESADEWMAAWNRPFWEEAVRLWPHMMMAGPFAYLLMSSHAAQLMAAGGGGLIVGVTDGIVEGTAEAEYQGQMIWDLAHHCINRMLRGMSVEAKLKHIAVVTLMPGFMRTERVLQHMKTEEMKKMFRFDKCESPEYIGRAVAALAADPQVMEKTGKIHFVADLAKEYGFTDVDGKVIPRFNPFN
jgi:NAD(P)-dependent dehydrogenase (short-subunit alcohol dehydrogenase family)